MDCICCEKCFTSGTIRDYIRSEGFKGNCDFCEAQDVYCIEPLQLQVKFKPLINLYSTIDKSLAFVDFEERDRPQKIWTKLNEDWSIFSIARPETQEHLLQSMFHEDSTHRYPFLSSYVVNDGEYWEHRSSNVLTTKWDEFCQEIKSKNRFFPEKSLDLLVLERLLRYLRTTLVSGTTLYRGRICYDNNKITTAEMGTPPPNITIGGRANPPGIPYLYLSSSSDLATAETRPLVKDKVTIGRFKLIKDISLVDLRQTNINDPFRYKEELSEVFTYISFIQKMGEELSKTISRRQSDINYIPTQYLSEFIKSRGYEGIIYDSSLSFDKEFNVVLFDSNKTLCTNAKLYEISKLNYTSRYLG